MIISDFNFIVSEKKRVLSYRSQLAPDGVLDFSYFAAWGSLRFFLLKSSGKSGGGWVGGGRGVCVDNFQSFDLFDMKKGNF